MFDSTPAFADELYFYNLRLFTCFIYVHLFMHRDIDGSNFASINITCFSSHKYNISVFCKIWCIVLLKVL